MGRKLGSWFRILSEKGRGCERPQPRQHQGQWDKPFCQRGIPSSTACLLPPNKESSRSSLVIQSESLPPQPPVFIFVEVSPGKLAFWSIPDLSLFPFLLSSTPRFSRRGQLSPQNACVRGVLAPYPAMPFLASQSLSLALEGSCLPLQPALMA